MKYRNYLRTYQFLSFLAKSLFNLVRSAPVTLLLGYALVYYPVPIGTGLAKSSFLIELSTLKN